MVWELYRVSDDEIEEFANMDFDKLEEYLSENYSFIYGKYHKENDIVFPMDKGWDITRFLLKETDSSKDKIFNALDGRFIKSDVVKLMDKLFLSINTDGLREYRDMKKMIENEIYLAKRLSEWDDENFWEYIGFHIRTFKSAFSKAAKFEHGIVINRT
nr:DUF1877 family protein [uncultured Allomuricauda sp.]